MPIFVSASPIPIISPFQLSCQDSPGAALPWACHLPDTFQSANPTELEQLTSLTYSTPCSAMGKSRSATIILAYLLWKSYRNHHSHQYTPPSTSAPTPPIDPRPNQSRDTTAEPLTPDTALGLLRQGRPLAEPNDGFMEQLHLYHSMGCPDVIDTHPKYQRWLYQKHVQESLTVNQAPELDNIRFEDEHEDDSAGIVGKAKQQTRELDIKCRKCRRLLAKSNFLIDHQPPPPPADPQAVQHQKQSQVRKEEQNCAHLFVHPLSWMRDTLREGQLDGRLVCPNPKCGANVGKFAWQGMKCSCGGWVTPGFGLARGRVDEVVALRDRKGVGGRIERDGETGPSMGVRMPPGMRKEGGHL